MIEKFLLNQKLYKEIIGNNEVKIKNGSIEFLISSIICDYYATNKNIYVVLSNLYEAQKVYDKLVNIVKEDAVLFYPGDELVASELVDVSGDFKFERINTIVSILKEESKHIVIMNLNSAIKYQLNSNKWKNSFFSLKENQEIEREELLNKLLSMGYKKVYTVTKTAEFASRGEIVDIYPLNLENPVRIDFFDNTIDSIKEFDNETQKSINQITQVDLIPVSELFYSDDELKNGIDNLEKYKKDNSFSLEEETKLNQDILDLNLRQKTDNYLRYINFFDKNKETIFDFSKEKKVYIYDIQNVIDSYNRIIDELKEYCESIKSFNLLKYDYFITLEKLRRYSNVEMEGLSSYFKDGINPLVNKVDDYKGMPDKITSDLEYLSKTGIVILVLKNEVRLQRIKDIMFQKNIVYSNILNEADIKVGQVNIITNEEFVSLSIESHFITIINESTLFDMKYEFRKPKYKSVYKNTNKISHYDELKPDDYVVHFDYGIGVYKGLKTIDNAGVLRDYLQIDYAGGDTLYVPLEQINRIEKYNAGVDDNVRVTKLRTGQWEKAKERVRKKVHDISDKLIKLYAKRQASVGFSFFPDNYTQEKFENEFDFELTLDQKKAIYDVKKDMESDKVMDRLICGDVGYGKTEVALRAAFKAIMSGKQVAILAPTTILSQQHHKTFKDRMDSFGVDVALVNRFVPMKKQKEILKDVQTGKIDVLIGTHRILSSSIKYHDLGLLIIDEEQRFGVMHKEKIKQIKVNVDTITLSATPIPRTLQMSIAGIKDLSMIETPPKNRYPIQTYVLERNDVVIRDAILRELARGGQVFYMYNLVSTIDKVAAKIQRLVPDARICVGHGKMTKDSLENIINDFTEKKYDVLVCTTIIETGIDIPDCNTLIIHDANRLGLSQLYQLRGRVGRSDKIAYAYMMYEPKKILSSASKKRLEAIKEFNQLGSGYKIAMRDLAIRGAGDILGDEQSGFITSIGLETYLEILNEEMKKIKNQEDVKKQTSVVKSVSINRTIDSKYISNDDVKIEIHKKIDKLVSIKALTELEEELHDRFGDFNTELKYYMYDKLYDYFIKKADIDNIIENNREITLFFSKEKSANLDGNKLFRIQNEVSKNMKLHYFNYKIEIILDKKKFKGNEYIVCLCNFFDKLINES